MRELCGIPTARCKDRDLQPGPEATISRAAPRGRGAVFALLALALCGTCAMAAGIPFEAWPEGRVRFYNLAHSEFDAYSRNPAPPVQAWMRQKYFRMQVYTPYFDRRLAWYPDGWVYKDSYAIKPAWPVFRQHPEWVLRDAAGNMLFIPWGCSKGTCPQYAADFGNPAFRSHWIAEARAILAKGYQGLWIDDVNLTWRVGDRYGEFVNPIDPRTGRPMTLADWRRYFADFMEQVRAMLPGVAIAHNAIWFAGPASDPDIRREILAADYFNLERGATDSGLRGRGAWGFDTWIGFVDQVHALGRAVILMDYARTETLRNFGLAAYLLANTGRDMLGSDHVAWTAPDHWWRGYELDVGPAAGARYAWNGLLRRDFRCGIVLLNEPDQAPRTVALDSAWTTLDGDTVSAVTLKARQAAVLTRPCPLSDSAAAPAR